MREPNFGEGQFQQSVNSSIQFEVFQRTGIRVSAKIPTLPREFHLGWDTGFYFEWLPFGGLAEHDGCNFFIQYKLSKELTSRGAGQYSSWNCPYMRFRIPYRDRGQEDYSQWDKIKVLATRGYPAFYCTNSVLEMAELESLEVSGTLLASTPFLDIREIRDRHVYVSFISDSAHFFLHTDKEQIKILAWQALRDRLEHEEKTNLESGNKKLYETLVILGEKSEPTLISELLTLHPQAADNVSEKDRWLILEKQFHYFRWVYQKLFGLTLHRFI